MAELRVSIIIDWWTVTREDAQKRKKHQIFDWVFIWSDILAAPMNGINFKGAIDSVCINVPIYCLWKKRTYVRYGNILKALNEYIWINDQLSFHNLLGPSAPLILDGESLNVGTSFTYLEGCIVNSGCNDGETKMPIANGSTNFVSLYHLWCSRWISLMRYILFVWHTVWRVSLYGCKTWPFKGKIIMHISWQQRLWK